MTKKYILQKKGVRESTRAGYKTVTNILEKEGFGAKRIDKVKLSDAKEWLIKLQDQDGRSCSSIHTIRGVLRPAFQIAVDDDLFPRATSQVACLNPTKGWIGHLAAAARVKFVNDISIASILYAICNAISINQTGNLYIM